MFFLIFVLAFGGTLFTGVGWTERDSKMGKYLLVAGPIMFLMAVGCVVLTAMVSVTT